MALPPAPLRDAIRWLHPAGRRTLERAGAPAVGAGLLAATFPTTCHVAAVRRHWLALIALAGLGSALAAPAPPARIAPGFTVEPQRIAYHNPELRVDVGVALWGWPLPLDYNRDGLLDLVVIGSGRPYNGTYFFANTGITDPESGLPLLQRGVRLGRGIDSAQLSFVAGQPVVMTAGAEYPDFLHSALEHPRQLAAPSVPEIFGSSDSALTKPGITGIRSSQWKRVDYDGDGRSDLIVGLDYWGDYQWGRANSGGTEPTYDAQGKWKFGPLHGYVYLLRNTGTDAAPAYAKPVQLTAGGPPDAPAAAPPIDVYGRPSPCFGDFRGTGKLDLICGEFIDGFTFFENTGTRTAPRYAAGRKLTLGGVPLTMDLCMISPVECDFNRDGRLDLVVAQEDGRVAFLENTGAIVDGLPQFLSPRFFRQIADEVKFGVLSAPAACDLDGDGLEDLVDGNSAGYIGFIKNLGGTPPRWAAPVYLDAGGRTIHIQAGYNGDCQGPSEVKWGYTNVSTIDWDLDGLIDILGSDVWGKVYWFRNTGTRTAPRFAASAPLEVEWGGPAPKPLWNWWNPAGKELVIQWRCTPYGIDWNRDGLPDLVTLDTEGYLALFERRRGANGQLELRPGQRVFWAEGTSAYDSAGLPMGAPQSGLLRLNANVAGASGRRTFCFADWDGDGVLDLFVNSRPNINFFRGLGRDGEGRWRFRDEGAVHPVALAGHSTAPTIVHWSDRPHGDLLFGTEDGFHYFVPNPRNGPLKLRSE